MGIITYKAIYAINLKQTTSKACYLGKLFISSRFITALNSGFLFILVWNVESTFGDRNIPLLKLNLGLSPGFALQSRIPENILVDNSFVQRNVNRVPEQRWQTD